MKILPSINKTNDEMMIRFDLSIDLLLHTRGKIEGKENNKAPPPLKRKTLRCLI